MDTRTAQGLFYIADVVEEHGQTAKKTLKITLFGVIALHVLLLFDRDTPTLQVLVGLVAHLIYLALLPQFPFVHIRSPIAICSALAAVVNHFSWFLHLLLSDTYIYTYSEVGGIFVVCVWLCPLAFIVSLSSTEPLPITSGAAPTTSLAADDDDDDDDERTASRRPGSRKGRSLLAVFCRFLKSKGDQLLPLTHAPAFASPDPLSSSSASSPAAAAATTQPATAFPAVPMSSLSPAAAAAAAAAAASPAAAATTTGVPVPAIALLGVGPGAGGGAAHSQMTPHQRKQFVPAYTADDHTQ